MARISLCMIAKNEENYIGNCLNSIHDLVDEIIIVDTGSTDSTKEICRKFTDKVFDFEWENDFSKARNFSFSKATCEYIMWLDADDILLEKDRKLFKDLKNNLDNLNQNIVAMTYNYSFHDDGNVILSLKRNRIFNRKINPQWVGFMHEIVDVFIEDAYDSDITITHTRKHSNTKRNLKIYEQKRRENVEFSDRDKLYYAKELFYNGKNYFAINEFKKVLKMNLWIEDRIDVLIKMSDCYRELETEQLKQAFENRNKNLLDRRREPLFEALKISYPRAEVLYRIGVSYVEEKRYYEAIFYFKSILSLDYDTSTYQYVNQTMWDFLPNLQLCFLYHSIGDIDRSIKHHEKCKELQPNNPDVIYNDKYFSKFYNTCKL